MKFGRFFSFFLLMVLLQSSPALAESRKVTFIHINDVYQLLPVDGMGGMAHVESLLAEYRKKDPNLLLTHGGDALSPSLLSGKYYGEQMIDLLNAIRVDVAVPGNHEFDFGPENMVKQLSASKAVWLSANMITTSGEQLQVTKENWLREVNGVKIGFFGLITPATANSSKPGEDLLFLPVIETARKEVDSLKKQGAEMIVALTHLLLSEDRQLAASVKDINLILGGHDHDPVALFENNTLILKSGTDNKYVGIIEMEPVPKQPDKPAQWHPSWKLRPVVNLPADPEIQALVDQWQKKLDEFSSQPLYKVSQSFNSFSTETRSRENPMGNLIADSMRAAVQADVALLNGGSIRGNRNYPVGYTFTLKDILTELPFNNVTLRIVLKGSDLLTALENGVSTVGDQSGRFPHVSGIKLVYDPSQPAGSRIVSTEIDGTPISPDDQYKVAISDYLFSGKDGYDILRQGILEIDQNEATLVTSNVQEWLSAHPDWIPRAEGRVVTGKK